MPRLKALPRRAMSDGRCALGLVGILTSVGTGAFLYNQMNVENTYRTNDQQEELLASYEKEYFQYADLKQPSITDVTLAVDLYPEERRMEASGTYTLVNNTDEPD